LIPADATEGTSTERAVLPQLETEASSPLNVTVEEPCDGPKFVPETRTDVPTVPDVGDRPVIAGIVVKPTAFEAMPLTVTITGPVLAALGTEMVIEILDHEVAIPASVPLKLTVEEP